MTIFASKIGDNFAMIIYQTCRMDSYFLYDKNKNHFRKRCKKKKKPSDALRRAPRSSAVIAKKTTNRRPPRDSGDKRTFNENIERKQGV